MLGRVSKLVRNSMRILLAGDTHGNSYHVANIFAKAHAGGAQAIVELGDYGYGWHFKQFKATGGAVEDEFTHNVSALVAASGIPFYWLDGNHENFDKLYELPIGDDGLRIVAPGVTHVPRGTILTWDGIRFLFCGGAVSVDKQSRVEGKSWWSQESLTQGDVDKCKAAGKSDVVFTHDAPSESGIIDHHTDPWWPQEQLDASLRNRQYVSEILRNSGAKLLFHGHMHRRFSDVVQNGVIVRGLDRDNAPMKDSTFLLDTREEPMLGYIHVGEPGQVDSQIRNLSNDSWESLEPSEESRAA